MSSRINGYGGGSAAHQAGQRPGQQQGPQQGQEERRSRFVARYQPGDVVYGVPLGPGPGSLTWVDIGGHSLLADIGPYQPDSGTPLYCFLVERVQPEIVLKLHADDAHSRASHSRSGLPARAASLYLAARSAMERHLAGALWPDLAQAGAATRQARRNAFLKHLDESAEARKLAELVNASLHLLEPLLARFAALNRVASAHLIHAPWLDAEATELDCLVLVQAGDAPLLGGAPYNLDPDALAQVPGLEVRCIYGCLRPDTGRMVCEAHFRPTGATARLLAEAPDALRALAANLSAQGAEQGEFPLVPPGTTLSEIGPLAGHALAPLDAVLAVVGAARLRRKV